MLGRFFVSRPHTLKQRSPKAEKARGTNANWSQLIAGNEKEQVDGWSLIKLGKYLGERPFIALKHADESWILGDIREATNAAQWGQELCDYYCWFTGWIWQRYFERFACVKLSNLTGHTTKHCSNQGERLPDYSEALCRILQLKTFWSFLCYECEKALIYYMFNLVYSIVRLLFRMNAKYCILLNLKSSR